jgi:hypothetical protein
MDENARDILDQARATLARLEGIESEFAADNEIRDARDAQMWRTPTQKETPKMTTQDWSGWNTWAEEHVKRGVEELASIMGEEVGKVERGLLEQIAELREELAQLRAEQVVERAARNLENVVDLPDWRKRDAA